jgi:hypothetical protein
VDGYRNARTAPAARPKSAVENQSPTPTPRAKATLLLMEPLAASPNGYTEIILNNCAKSPLAANFLPRVIWKKSAMDEITIPHSRPVCCTRGLHSKGVPL